MFGQTQTQLTNRLVDLLVDAVMYGDVAEVPWPSFFRPENLTAEQECRWSQSLDDEQRTRLEIAAMIHVFAYGHPYGCGGSVAEHDEELKKLLQERGFNQDEHTSALEELAQTCDTTEKRAMAYARMVALLTPEQLSDVKVYVEETLA